MTTRLPMDLLSEITTHLVTELGPDVPAAVIAPVVERCAADLQGQTTGGAYPELVTRLARERLQSWLRDADRLALGRAASNNRPVVGAREPASRVRSLTQPDGEHDKAALPDSQGLTVGLPDDPRSAREARAWVHSTLAMVLPPSVVETAELLASELVTNALWHAGTELSVHLRHDRSSVRIEVHDGDVETIAHTHVPNGTLHQRVLNEGGRGLFLVEALADRWGVNRHAWGKSVWCELSLL